MCSKKWVKIATKSVRDDRLTTVTNIISTKKVRGFINKERLCINVYSNPGFHMNPPKCLVQRDMHVLLLHSYSGYSVHLTGENSVWGHFSSRYHGAYPYLITLFMVHCLIKVSLNKTVMLKIGVYSENLSKLEDGIYVSC